MIHKDDAKIASSGGKKKYREYNPNQIFLIPLSLKEWLPENHPVYFLSDIGKEMNLISIEVKHERGQKNKINIFYILIDNLAKLM